jgi:hypothetical protein
MLLTRERALLADPAQRVWECQVTLRKMRIPLQCAVRREQM